MPKLKLQGPDWVSRNISMPLGLVCAILYKSTNQAAPEDLPDFIRRTMIEKTGYVPDMAHRYIKWAVDHDKLDPATLKLVEELHLLEPPEPDDLLP